jgi:hypothetical protein
MSKLSPQRVVCAACRRKDSGLIVVGARHFDVVMRCVIKSLHLDYAEWDQGFIDQHCNFLTRKEAFKIAKQQNQILRKTGNQGDQSLTSEDLY